MDLNDWMNTSNDNDASEPAPDNEVSGLLRALFQLQGQDSRRTGSVNTSGISMSDIQRLISSGAVSLQYGDDDEEDEDYEDEDSYYTRRGFGPIWHPPHKQPQPTGVELLMGGDFGPIASKTQSRRSHAIYNHSVNKNISKQILNRTLTNKPLYYRETFARDLVPNSVGGVVASFDANVYTAQFSADSSFFYTCAQDFKLHVFDMTSPPEPVGRRHVDPGLRTSLPVKKSIQGAADGWTITDANLSPDNERMIYASMSPTVYMTTIHDDSTHQVPISFADRPQRPGRRGYFLGGGGEHFAVWSCRFSADGNEVIAGGSNHIFVYDLLADRRTVKIYAHADDVNSCCWADTASGNVLVSASDDTYLKVWDRRSLGSSQKPSGVLIGHTEGITYVSAKGDGRYVISNGKDQALRLWDLRMMRSGSEADDLGRNIYSTPGFDYRYPNYPKPKRESHPKNCSVMTYRGHSVLRTLIRCHFSPAETTGGQYIYSGSADGRVHIWSLDGTVVEVLDRSTTIPMAIDSSGPENPATFKKRESVCVRDVSWHTHEPVLMSAAWDGGMRGREGSSLARHEWKGLSKMKRLEDVVEQRILEAQDSSTVRRRSQRQQQVQAQSPESTSSESSQSQLLPGSFPDDDDWN